ncbi:hypothetical protein BH23VER1_BH23VER1_31120 [soil metagenome]
MNVTSVSYQNTTWPVLLLPLVLVALLVGGLAYRRYLGITFLKGALVALGALLLAGAIGWIYLARSGSLLPGRDPLRLVGTPILLLAMTGVPLALRLYAKWVGDKATPAERSPGVVSVRAWLGFGNLVCVLGVALGLWLAFGYSFWSVLILGFMVLLAYPLMISAGAGSMTPPPAPVSPDLTEERQQVLRMLAAGTIQSDEAADLLRALGETADAGGAAAAGRGRVWTQREKLAVAGAGIILIAFFFPWMSINLGQELERATGAMGMPFPSGVLPGNQASHVAAAALSQSHHIAASDISYGRGWLILGAALVAAWLTLVPRPGGLDLPRWAPAAAWGIGILFVVVLAATGFRHLSSGMLLAIAGYAVLAPGVWHRRPAPELHPGTAPTGA